VAVRIRLMRMGRKKKPFYRIVAIDSRKKRDGAYIDKVGHYNAIVEPAEVMINEERALYWLQKGAIPSDTVKSLLSRQGIILKFDMMKKKFSEEKIDEEMKKWHLLQTERVKRQEAQAIQQKQQQESAISEETHETEVEAEEEN